MVSTTLMLLLGALSVAVVLELILLKLTRRFALLALPNDRSSHLLPTPTLGGIAIVVVVLGFLLTSWWQQVESAAGLFAAGVLLATVGLWDDLREVSSFPRLFAHVLAAAMVVTALDLDWPAVVLAAAGFLLVWHVNLFNFMDGIDGIAGVQVIVYGVGAMVCSGGIPGWLGDLNLVLIGATLGFLAFNWAPAKIFMGDVGSGFLGLILGAEVIALADYGFVPLIGSLILLTVFWFDASYTLCVRIVTGQRFMSAHRSHLYQKLALRWGHGWTSGVFALTGAIWLLPLALLAQQRPDWAPAVLLLAALPVATGCIYLRAGMPEPLPEQKNS